MELKIKALNPDVIVEPEANPCNTVALMIQPGDCMEVCYDNRFIISCSAGNKSDGDEIRIFILN